MNGDLNSARDDLAFLRALVNDAPRTQSAGGWLFLAGGVLFGLQCLFFWAQMVFRIQLPAWGWMVPTVLPTVLFLIALVLVVRQGRKSPQTGVATRAMNAAWSSTGLVTMTVIVVFAFNAWREQSLLIWLLYPIIVCAVQGGVWYVAYMIRKRAWLAGVSAGWLVSAMALGFMTRNMDLYGLTIGIALLLFMALPGWIMVRQAARETA